MENKNSNSFLKFICDFLPLLIFFLVYKISNDPKPIIPATIALVVTTFVALTINYVVTKKIAKVPLFSALLLGFFGLLTIFSGDDFFIKIKPTLINLLFASILMFGVFAKKPLLKMLLGNSFVISDKAWLTLSMRWAFFFIFLAILNEFIWRNFSTDFWVQFKVFGILPLSIIFTLSQIPYLIKQQKNYNS
ncbi:MAG: intracellular septation protein [Rickettsiales bacterium]|jgi:intracellular septation protein